MPLGFTEWLYAFASGIDRRLFNQPEADGIGVIYSGSYIPIDTQIAQLRGYSFNSKNEAGNCAKDYRS